MVTVRLTVRVSRSMVSRFSFRVSWVGVKDKFRVGLVDLQNSRPQSTSLLRQQHGNPACEKPARMIPKFALGIQSNLD